MTKTAVLLKKGMWAPSCTSWKVRDRNGTVPFEEREREHLSIVQATFKKVSIVPKVKLTHIWVSAIDPLSGSRILTL